MALLNFPRLQSIYYTKVKEHSPAKVGVRFPTFTHADALAAFTGDGEVTYSPVTELACLYRLRPTPDYRAKHGIDENCTAVLWVPMVELQLQLPGELQRVWEKRQQLDITFMGERYDVVLVRAYEPFGAGFTEAIGWELQLVQKEDNRGK